MKRIIHSDDKKQASLISTTLLINLQVCSREHINLDRTGRGLIKYTISLYGKVGSGGSYLFPIVKDREFRCLPSSREDDGVDTETQ